MQRSTLGAILAVPVFAIGAMAIESCSAKRGPDDVGLMVIVTTDGRIDVSSMKIMVWKGDKGGKLQTNEYKKSTFSLPNALAILSDGNPSTSVVVRVEAYNSMDIVVDVREQIVLRVPVDRVAVVPIVLSTNCTGKAAEAARCTDGMTCNPSTGTCVSATVSASSLATYTPGVVVDGGVGIVDTSITDTSDATDTKVDSDVLVDTTIVDLGDTAAVSDGDAATADGCSVSAYPPAASCSGTDHEWQCWSSVGLDTSRSGDFSLLTVCGDRVILDTKTKLMWARNEEDGTLKDGVFTSWDAARKACVTSRRAGFADWRMPTKVELQSIIDFGRGAPTVDPLFEGNIAGSKTVSSSKFSATIFVPAGLDNVWDVSFEFGTAGTIPKNVLPEYKIGVRCVR